MLLGRVVILRSSGARVLRPIDSLARRQNVTFSNLWVRVEQMGHTGRRSAMISRSTVPYSVSMASRSRPINVNRAGARCGARHTHTAFRFTVIPTTSPADRQGRRSIRNIPSTQLTGRPKKADKGVHCEMCSHSTQLNGTYYTPHSHKCGSGATLCRD